MWGRRTGGQAVGRSVARVGGLLRRIAGMPDYGAYIEHLRRDLASGAWDRKYGHLRTAPEYNGSLRLVVARP